MNANIGLVANLLEALMFDCDRIPHHIPVTFKRTQKSLRLNEDETIIHNFLNGSKKF